MCRTRRSTIPTSSAWIILTGLAFFACIASAQEGETPQELSPNILLDQKAIDDTAPDFQSAVDAEKRRKASAGLAAVGAIAILGVGIIAATMMWAKRLRRLARDPGPPQKTAGNDFWFLKPPKPIVEDAGTDDGEQMERRVE